MADIVMPQLGETVTEGTITKWFKHVGDPVAEDEVLFEVSTDKVDSEVPSPVGRLRDRDPGARGRHGRRRHRARRRRRRSAGGAARPCPGRAGRRRSCGAATAAGRGSRLAAPAAPGRCPADRSRPPPAPAPPPSGSGRAGRSVGGRPASGVVLSPLVRRLIAEHGLDPAVDPRHRRRRSHHPQRRRAGHRGLAGAALRSERPPRPRRRSGARRPGSGAGRRAGAPVGHRRHGREAQQHPPHHRRAHGDVEGHVAPRHDRGRGRLRERRAGPPGQPDDFKARRASASPTCRSSPGP